MNIIRIKRSTEKEKKLLDKMSYPVNIIFPLLTIPQVIEIFTNKSAEGVSEVTWILYAVMSFLVLLWAIADNIRQLIISQSVWLIMYGLVIAGIFVYR
ncbi:TPA: hypothetical protein EYO12_02420 [Candidatus Saccharibacteria bacterium]|nr:hypothetical protein [Candidatus Saccharibacteria bacterium]HIO87644.1 hypothetical protein [Candidatus Saccharibacteria bacterium]